MSARQIGRPNPTSQARLQLILILLAAWNLAAFVFELLNTGPIRVGGIDGVLGARAVDGASGVLALAYIFGARDPLRYRFVLWLAMVEQFLTIFTATFHWARDDVSSSEIMLPVIVAALFLITLLTSLPRQVDTA